MDLNTAYIGLGSNLGDRRDYIDKALQLLRNSTGIDTVRVSNIIESEPLASMDQPLYLNAVAEIKTTLPPHELFEQMVDIEKAIDREKKGKWSSRTIDLDLLFFGDQILNTPDLTVPHSQMHLRSFILKPLSQLAADLIHPVLNVSIEILKQRLNGLDFTIDPSKRQLISIAGIIGAGKTTLAKIICEKFEGKLIFEDYDNNPYLPRVYKALTRLLS